jgi:hypothetical protein
MVNEVNTESSTPTIKFISYSGIPIIYIRNSKQKQVSPGTKRSYGFRHKSHVFAMKQVELRYCTEVPYA